MELLYTAGMEQGMEQVWNRYGTGGEERRGEERRGADDSRGEGSRGKERRGEERSGEEERRGCTCSIPVPYLLHTNFHTLFHTRSIQDSAQELL